MERWNLGEAAVAGALGSLFSAAVLALAGGRECRALAAPLNATSQWLWGTSEARRSDDADRRHTLTGYLVHHGAATFWALLHAAALGDRPAFSRPGPAMAAAAGTAAVAALVDLKLTPERFTPGFQHRISTASLAATYAAFGLGLALGSLAVRRRRGDQAGPRAAGRSSRPSRRAASSADFSTASGSLAGKVYSTAVSSTSS